MSGEQEARNCENEEEASASEVSNGQEFKPRVFERAVSCRGYKWVAAMGEEMVSINMNENQSCEIE